MLRCLIISDVLIENFKSHWILSCIFYPQNFNQIWFVKPYLKQKPNNIYSIQSFLCIKNKILLYYFKSISHQFPKVKLVPTQFCLMTIGSESIEKSK